MTSAGHHLELEDSLEEVVLEAAQVVAVLLADFFSYKFE